MTATIDLPLLPTFKDQPWRAKAKCAGQSIDEFDPDKMPSGRYAHQTRAVLAQARCSGCPVKKQCAADAIDSGDRGLVRAGVVIPTQSGNEAFRSANRALHRIAEREMPGPPKGTGYPKPCTHCDRMMRPHGYDEIDYPGTILVSSSGVTICGSCYQKLHREGKL